MTGEVKTKDGGRNEVIIFTDGASRGNPGPGGWGAVIVYDNNARIDTDKKSRINADENNLNQGKEVFELGGAEKNTTNNRMELTAVIEALLKIKDQKPEIVICTDSRYLIDGITKWVFGWQKNGWLTKNKEPVLNKDLWQKLLEATQGKKIEWQHVAGHSGIAGNERADKIATAFADDLKPQLYSGPFSQYSVSDVRRPQSNVGKPKPKGRSGKAYSYLSKVDGKIEKHQTWTECEKRVKGESGARFKKAMSPEEEKEIIESWSR